MNLYRLILLISALALPLIFLIRRITGKDTNTSLKQRLGFAQPTRPVGPLIWLHAASLGELNTLSLLLAPLHEQKPDHQILVTVGNLIAYNRAQELNNKYIATAVAPLDYTGTLRRFLNHWRPEMLITLENEIWPNRLLSCKSRGIPVVFVNARMSERSHRSWQRRPEFATKIMDTIEHAFAQDTASFERLAALGLPAERLEMRGNLKQFQDGEPPAETAELAARFPREKTMAAASTHRGEDEVLIAAFLAARTVDPSRRLILVPRHVKRSKEVQRLLMDANLQFSRRSQRRLPRETDAVFLADTTGEMPLWYAGAALTFVAGSLTDVGGHTPYEPAAFGSAILHGGQYANFQDIYDELRQRGGSICADTAAQIAAAWDTLSVEGAAQAQAAKAKDILFTDTARAEILDPVITAISQRLG